VDHVNNVAWVRFIAELADAHSCALGLDRAAYLSLGGMWFVRRHEVEYLRAASLGDSIVEETWLSELRGAHCLRNSRFRSRGSGELLVASVTRWVWVTTSNHRPARIPPEVLSRFTVVTADGTPPSDPR
jgi:acyl-CoA thioester hydrolase